MTVEHFLEESLEIQRRQHAEQLKQTVLLENIDSSLITLVKNSNPSSGGNATSLQVTIGTPQPK